MKMTELNLLGWLRAEQQGAYRDSDNDIDRPTAMKRYLREPYGNEAEGRSQVVASDVFDSIEGMLPDLIEVFTASDKAVVFDPVSAEDEAGAEQATNACNYVFYKANNGFLTLYTAAKDALLLRTGGVKWYWDVKRTPSWTTYRNVPEMQIALFLQANPDAEIVSKEPSEPDPQMVQQAAMMGQELPPMFTIRVKTVESKGRVRVVPVPPEEIEISARHNSILLDECPYVAHVTEMTASAITEMGWKVDFDAIGDGDESEMLDRYFRDRESSYHADSDNDIDASGRRYWVREEFVLVDFDGDGIAERRKVVRIGEQILENVEVSHVPMACWTPYILAHRFEGISAAELVEDFQRIRTEVWRAQLDNLDLANNQETVVLTNSAGAPQANIDDLLNRRPGGIMRESVPNAIRPYSQRWQGIEAMPMLEMLESAKENRTGWTRYSQGLDGDSLNKTATGVKMVMNASQKRMKLMARIMAECLVAPMFRGIFKTLTDYCMEKLSFRLNGAFVQYDPQEWRDQYDTTINVGIGTGDVLQQQGFLMQMAGAQMALLQSPYNMLVSPSNVYSLQARMAENAGFKNPGEFWSDPAKTPPPPPQTPPPDPRIVTTQMQLQADAQKFQAEQVADAQKFQAELQSKMAVDKNRQEWEARQKQLELQQEAEIAAIKARYEAEAQAEKLALEKYKADLDAQVKIAISDKSAPDIAGMERVIETIAQQINAPVEVLRDESGTPVGVRKGAVTKRVVRDESGVIVGVQ